MSKYELVRLSDIFDLQMGKTPSRSKSEFWNDGSNKWVSIADLTKSDKYISTTKETISDLAVAKSGIKKVPKDTVIMSFKLSLGKTAITTEEMYTNEAIMSFQNIGRYASNNNFIYHLFSSFDWSINTNKAVMGATLNKATLTDIQIPLPPLEIQEKIAKNLDTASELVKLHKTKLLELDKLIQSVFYDMFGDPVTNEKGWSVEKLGDITSGKTSNGFFAKRDDYCSNGNVSILGVADIVNRMYSRMTNLPKTNATENDMLKFAVKYGDLLFCRSSLVAEGIGKASIIHKDVNCNTLFECHVIRVQLDLKKSVPEYIQQFTTSTYFRNQVLKYAKTSTMTTIGQDGIINNNILLPPLPLQEKFANIVTEIEKQKQDVQNALKDAEMLYNSLMQKYFE